MRVVLYTRVSTVNQRDEGSSLEDQEQRLRAWCDAGGHEVVELVVDTGSARAGSVGRRAGLVRVRELIGLGLVDGLVVTKLDRLSRSLLDYVVFMRELDVSGVAFVSADGFVDSSTPMGRAMVQMAMVFAELERELIRERIVDALSAKRERGERVGRPPIGRCVRGGEVVWLPGWFAVRVLAEDLYADVGCGLSGVAERLGVRPDGLQWNRESVRRLLADPAGVAVGVVGEGLGVAS